MVGFLDALGLAVEAGFADGLWTLPIIVLAPVGDATTRLGEETTAGTTGSAPGACRITPRRLLETSAGLDRVEAAAGEAILCGESGLAEFESTVAIGNGVL